jgi:hypothetical protein
MALAPPASAGFVAVVGQGNILDANVPGSTGATPNFFQDQGANRVVHGWNERQGVVLSQNLFVDIVSPGFYDQIGDLGTFNQFSIAAGTRVNSHLLYYDPRNNFTVSGVTFTFTGQILGIIVESDRFWNNAHGFTDYFVNSDFLGHPNTGYPAGHFVNRGLEFNTDDLTFLVSGNQLTLNYTAGNPGDQIRVITAVVPAPMGALLVASAVPVLFMRRLFRRKA